MDGYIQTTYLVEYRDGLLLFDSGTNADVDVFLSFIESELKRDISDLKLVVVSHMHPDHSGGAMRLKKKTGCKIAAPFNANEWYQGVDGSIEKSIDTLLTYYVAKKKNRKYLNIVFPKHLEIDYPLQDGDRLPLFADWSVMSAYGHTTCDISLINEKENYIYIADNIVKTGRGFVLPYPMVDPVNFKEVIERYQKLPIEKYLLAHHGMFQKSQLDFDSILKKVRPSPRTHLSYLKHKLNKIKEILSFGP